MTGTPSSSCYLALGGALHLLAAIDISRRKGPQPFPRLHGALLQEDAPRIGNDDRDSNFRVEIGGRGWRAHCVPSIRVRMRA